MGMFDQAKEKAEQFAKEKFDRQDDEQGDEQGENREGRGEGGLDQLREKGSQAGENIREKFGQR